MTATDDRYWQLAEALLDELRDDDPPRGCAHAQAAPVLHACAFHPAAGLACTTCARSHLQRHHVDLGCVVCGAEGATSGWHRAWPVMSLEVALPDGGRLSWTGEVDALLGYRCAPAEPTGP